MELVPDQDETEPESTTSKAGTILSAITTAILLTPVAALMLGWSVRLFVWAAGWS